MTDEPKELPIPPGYAGTSPECPVVPRTWYEPIEDEL